MAVEGVLVKQSLWCSHQNLCLTCKFLWPSQPACWGFLLKAPKRSYSLLTSFAVPTLYFLLFSFFFRFSSTFGGSCSVHTPSFENDLSEPLLFSFSPRGWKRSWRAMYKWGRGWWATEKENRKAHKQREGKSRGHVTSERGGDGKCSVPMVPRLWSFVGGGGGGAASCTSSYEIFLSAPNKPPPLGIS